MPLTFLEITAITVGIIIALVLIKKIIKKNLDSRKKGWWTGVDRDKDTGEIKSRWIKNKQTLQKTIINNHLKGDEL